MIRSLVAVAVAGLVLAGAAVASAQDAGAIEKGKKVYTEAMPKCKTCHAIAGEGNPKGVLDDVGTKLKTEDIKAWIRTPKQMTEKAKATRKPVMMPYPKEKISDADLDALCAYLLSLKKK